jgi:putative sigma-54 modulation protein
MNVSYRGIQEKLPQKLQEKLDTKFGKLSKLLEKRGEKEAHVVVTKERHLLNAEITLQFYDHQLVGIGSDGDLFAAMSSALEKLEKQAVNTRGKWREKARRHNGVHSSENGAPSLKSAKVNEAPAPVVKAVKAAPAQRVFRVNHLNRRKPMTLEEAMMEMENGREYMVYRDADRECLSVLVRRKDGNFDLIES